LLEVIAFSWFIHVVNGVHIGNFALSCILWLPATTKS